MSIRANPRTATQTSASAPAAPITFKDEFVHSTAALAASHDETVSHILSRLDQLSAKIQTQPEQNGGTPAPAPRSTATTTSNTRSAVPTDTSVHARLSNLESVNESTLHRLSTQLDTMEQRLKTNRESEKLMTQIAAKLQQVEPRLKSHAEMGDRLARIESQLQSHVGRVANLEARVDRPDPDQARILSRINSKLDLLEQQQHNRREAGQPPGNNTTKRSSSDYNTDSRSVSHLDAEMDRQERAKYLQTRIEKLKELRSKYEKADME